MDTLNDFADGRLSPPERPPSGHPVIVSASGENMDFRRSSGNERLPLLETFLAPLSALKSFMSFSFSFDFGIVQMPPSLFAPSAITELSASVLEALQQKYAIRINLINLRDYGILQDRKVLVILASRFPGLVSVPLKPHTESSPRPSRHPETVGDIIRELNFQNPRMREGTCGGFVSSLVRDGDHDHEFSSGYIYNHSTGGRDAQEFKSAIPSYSVSMDDDTVSLSWDRQQPPCHRGE